MGLLRIILIYFYDRMLGLSSERKLLNLFEVIRDEEIRAETLRQRLAMDPQFAPSAAFQRVDRDQDGRVNCFELKDFLHDQREYHITENDCYNLLKFYDLDKDSRLTAVEFQQMLLPCEDNLLRQRSQARFAYRVGRFERLPLDLEQKLNSVLCHEVSMLKRLAHAKNELVHSFDFSTFAAYKSVDRWNDGAITIDNLKWFFRLNQKYITDKEALSIIRRVETDGDGKISYFEFSDFINLQISAYPAKLYQAQPQRAVADDYGLRATQHTPLRDNRKARALTTDKKQRVKFEDEMPLNSSYAQEASKAQARQPIQAYQTPVKKQQDPNS